jgi:hypothetical protein
MMLKEFQESSNTSGGSKKEEEDTPASRNKIQTKVFSKANVFNTTYIVHMPYDNYQVEDIR